MPPKKRKRSPNWFWRRYPELTSQRPQDYAGRISVDITESQGRFKVVLTLGDGVTGKDIRKAIPFALEVRDCLVDWQGVELSNHAKWLLHAHDQGWSYAQIADGANEMLSKYAMTYAKFLARDFVFKNQELLEKFIYDTTDLKIGSESAQPFYELLKAMRVNSEKSRILVINARISNYRGWNGLGGDVFFTRDDVINAIRYWRGKKKQKRMVKTGPKSTIVKRKG